MKNPIIQLREGEKVMFEISLWQIINELSLLNLLKFELKETTKLYLNNKEIEKSAEKEDDE